ncbi:MAG: hypothetical protein V2I33_06605, partial [Kangiellaceae bacterium]|nr:hypothetical protein [Kangiellaceae bacterium]
MRYQALITLLVAVPMLFAPSNGRADSSFSGSFGGDVRIFTDTASLGQDDYGVSVFTLPEWYFEFDDSTFTFKPFYRYDSMDDERTHGDIREAYWETVGDEWSLNVGYNKVFWGVAETQHLVDIINQTDQVENIDGEDKLGQLMINYNFEKDWGNLSLFLLPQFRERTLPGPDGRLRFELPYDVDRAAYESSQGDQHLDLAARVTTSVD